MAVASGAGVDAALRRLPALSAAHSDLLPLWAQVADSVRDFGDRNALHDPLRLPPEVALAEHYGVSVSTVRQALATLEAEGRVTRRRRLGTYVSAGPVQSRALRLTGGLDSVVHQQTSDKTRVLSRRVVPVPALLRDVFSDVEQLVEFRRVRSNGGAVVSYAENYLRRSVGDRIKKADLQSGSMTQLLRDTLGLRLARIENEVEAAAATPHIAQLLEIEPRSPVLVSRNKTIDAGTDVVDAAFIYYRGDRFRFSVEVSVA